jgi:hypothetical protein
MTALTEIYGAGVLTLITLIVSGLLIVVYYSLGIIFLFFFIFLLYLFIFRSVNISLEFRNYD